MPFDSMKETYYDDNTTLIVALVKINYDDIVILDKNAKRIDRITMSDTVNIRTSLYHENIVLYIDHINQNATIKFKDIILDNGRLYKLTEI